MPLCPMAIEECTVTGCAYRGYGYPFIGSHVEVAANEHLR